MSLCRFFPSPSDRMAIIWSLMPVENAIVLEYGPAGTTHFGGGMYSSLGIRMEHSLFTTHISEDDVIMGDVSRLEKAIVELDETYAPEVIFVVASAVIAVIGTDIRGVCRYMQERVNARLIAFEDGGFRGDYTYGLRAVYRMMTKELVKGKMPDDVQKEEKTFQILGASAGSYRVRSDVWEIQELMKEAFGWKCRLVMGLESTIGQLESAGASCLNLAIRCEAIEAAEALKKRFDTPYVYGAPYGYQGTLDWLTEISKVIKEPVNPELKDRLEEKILYNNLPMSGGPMAQLRRKQPKAIIQGDYDTVKGIAGAMKEMGVSVSDQICSHSLKAVENPQADIVHYPKEKQRLEIYRAQHDTWVLGDNQMPQICPADNYFTCISFPFTGKPQIAKHLPYMGEKGMDYLMECKEVYFAAAGIR